MKIALSAQDLRFRSAWLDLPLTRWELLSPSWEARKTFLESQGLLEAYQKDAFWAWARDFLTLQGLVYFSPESWEPYRRAGYSLVGLVGAGPTTEEAHDRLHRYVAALEEAFRKAQANQPLTPQDLQTWMEKATGRPLSLRQTSVDGPYPLPNLPPTEIPAALEKLFSEIEAQVAAGVSPLWVAGWAHHAFTQIRPYTEGNARAAFLLSQYLLWRAGLPGLYLRPFQRATYYAALQAADEGRLEPWGQLLLEGLQQAVLYALSWGQAPLPSYEESLEAFNQRFAGWRARHDRDRSQRIMNNRYTVFDYLEELLRQTATDLEEKLKLEEGKGPRVLVAKAYPDSPYYYQFSTDIVEYARKYGYYFNRGLPRGWFKLKFSLSANKKYQLVFPLHHVGHEDATLAVGALLHFLEPLKYQQKRIRGRRRARKEKSVYLFVPLPLSLGPLVFSIEKDVPAVRGLLRSYVQEALRQALSELANEIY
ncbi:MAG: hypothetical protein KatS3mg026_0626 [Bacteroidia bacterium]|nr:MAG: hypothetical protein KatS3mg026_0626 [Bacteroidia bacterium]